MALLTCCWLMDIGVLLLSALAALYISFKWQFTYWKRREVPTPGPPGFPYGHFGGLFEGKAIGITLTELYTKMNNEPFFGSYFFKRPILIVRNLDLIKQILVKDFNVFHDRGFPDSVDKEPLGSNLVLLNGQKWRNLRIKLTPTFTSGKIKNMFPTLVAVGKELDKVIEENSNQPETDVKDILARFMTDIISSCAFGIEANSLQNPDTPFRKVGIELNQMNLKKIISILTIFFCPSAVKYLPFTFVPKHISDFFVNTVRDNMQYRIDNNIKRNDFFQLIMQLRTQGYVADADHATKDEDNKTQQKFTVEEAAAQAYIFFLAGFETSSSTILFALYELALNPDLQSELQQEIKEVNQRHGDELTFDGLHEMSLLDRVVAETLRKYPISTTLMRESSEDYTIPDSSVVIEKGQVIWIPIYSIQNDPQIFPNPEKFDPDRFLPEEKQKRHHYAYIPFGEGPRTCIGNSFALVQTKAGLAMILSRFTVSPSQNTMIPIVFDPKIDLLTPKGKLLLKFTLNQD